MFYPVPLVLLPGETVLAQTGTMNGLIPIDWKSLRPFLLNLMGALGIFIIAWIAAILLSGIGQNILKRTGVDTRLSELISGTAETPIQAGKLVGQIIFWLAGGGVAHLYLVFARCNRIAPLFPHGNGLVVWGDEGGGQAIAAEGEGELLRSGGSKGVHLGLAWGQGVVEVAFYPHLQGQKHRRQGDDGGGW